MQKRVKKIIFSKPLVGLFLMFALSAQAADGFLEWLLSLDSMNGVNPALNETYREECGSCHFAYQPGLLPARSWEKLLTPEALAKHFGENAELDEANLNSIRDYVLNQAADHSDYKLSKKVMAATRDGATPLRITELRFIARIHHGIPTEKIQGNPKVRSLSQCNACHTKAEQGIYLEDTVHIPEAVGIKP